MRDGFLVAPGVLEPARPDLGVGTAVDPPRPPVLGPERSMIAQVAVVAEAETPGRIHGRADTEVGARWLEDAWRDDEPVAHLLASLHDRFGGEANLAVLAADGTPHHYAGNGENPVFTFRLGRIGIASTGIYSLDRSLFRFVAPSATERRLVRQRVTVSLERNGNPSSAF